MYLIVTRSFPPETGGMQNLMWGLSNSLSKYFMIKVFADYHNQHQNYDKKVSFSIERIGGIKLLRKYTYESGGILPSRVTSVSQKKQKELSKAIKRARILALI